MMRTLRPELFVGAVVRPIQAFFKMEAAGGIVLLLAAAAALILANSGAAEAFHHLVELPIALELAGARVSFTLHHVINDGLMTLFFAVVGMEIKRELVAGELRTVARALLPLIAALGGMVVPAAIYVAFTAGTPGIAGWGIPMATDIAFCIGLLTLLRGRVAHALVVYLTALAIFDDIGGILVIAFFYGTGVNWLWLAGGAGVTAIMVVGARRGVVGAAFYTLLGAALWLALHEGGIHATLAGVITGLAVPVSARRDLDTVLRELADHTSNLLEESSDREQRNEQLAAIDDVISDLHSPLQKFIHALHPWVAFGVMPLFALANAGVALELDAGKLTAPVTLGVTLGLLVGKPVGIFLCTWIALRAGLAPRPGDASNAKLFGIAVVAGIGFTVALFIASLAFARAPELLAEAKLGILLGSGLAGLLGTVILLLTRRT
jgi:NhaA family Na+:H+ antiporter